MQPVHFSSLPKGYRADGIMSALPLTNTMLVHLHHQLPCNVDACNQPCQVKPDIVDLLATTSTAVATPWTIYLAAAATSSGVAAASCYCSSACFSYCSPYSSSDVPQKWSTRVLLPDVTTNSDVQSICFVAASLIDVQNFDDILPASAKLQPAILMSVNSHQPI